MIRINLLPPEKRKKIKKVKPGKKAVESAPRIKLELKFDPLVGVAAALAVATVLAMGGAHFWLGRSQAGLERRRSEMRADLTQLNRVVMKIDELKNRNRELARKMDVILEVDRNRYLWPHLLDAISSALPQYTWLENVSETSPFPQLVLRIEGTTMSNLSLGRLMENLERSPLLEKVSLVSSTERREGTYDTKYFILECACELNHPADSTQVAARK